jgi:hypothetical protein
MQSSGAFDSVLEECITSISSITVSHTKATANSAYCLLPAHLALSLTLKMKVIRSSETLAIFF